MAGVTIDRSADYLLCTETESFDDDDEFGDDECVILDDQSHQNEALFKIDRSQPSIDFLYFESEESLLLMFQKEHETLPSHDYLQRLRNGGVELIVRRQCIDWIFKAHDFYCFGPLSFCLAINYLDRFLSVYEYDLRNDKHHMDQLLAVSCLSLAAKLDEVNVPLPVNLQNQVGDPKVLFEGKVIKRMELKLLSTLNWRMQACTPCSFIDYFLRNINNGHFFLSLTSQSIKLILSALKGIDFLEFKPSEISCAVALCVSEQIQTLDIDQAISNFKYIEKVRVLRCLEMVKDLKMNGEPIFVGSGSGQTQVVVPESPIGVLDAACLSLKCDEITVESWPNSPQTSPQHKRRRSEPNE